MLRLKRNRPVVTPWVFSAILAARLAAAAPADPYEAVDTSWERFGAVFGRILQDYYTEVLPDSIMLGAIQGMLERLDAYSHYYDADGMRQLREDTTGRFAGLGVSVTILSGEPVVVSPMDGTPAQRAGLLPGDIIVAIEGHPTRTLTLDDVVELLHGDAGSVVHLTIRHPAPQTATYDIAITREIIQIPSVVLVHQPAPGVGYIGMRQTRFAENTAHEVATAISQLADSGVSSLVLDLRGNPGGLLTQAIEVADLFLPRGAPIVSIREREHRHEEVRRSEHRPLAKDLPLVVLIDGGSASASEIVAGAIQDNDRGVLLGTTSFGKGSVQTIFDLHEPSRAGLKLTTARYYTPSGRSIHRGTSTPHTSNRRVLFLGDCDIPLPGLLQLIARSPDKASVHAALTARFGLDRDAADRLLDTTLGQLADAATAVAAADSTAPERTRSYHTHGGRPVYGGGGIAPDISLPLPPVPGYVRHLQRAGAFFQFAVTRLAADSIHVAALRGTALDDYLLGSFATYAAENAKVPPFDVGPRKQLQRLRKELADAGLLGATSPQLVALEAALTAAGSQGYPPVLKAAILRSVHSQLTLRLHGQRARDLERLRLDMQLAAAVELLEDETAYAAALGGGS